MILIGQFDSPFVRRVGIALTLYGMPFEHRPWSVFGDADRLRSINPLMRVPTLVTDEGIVLTDSNLICAHLDDQAGPALTLRPADPDDRAMMLHVVGLASGLAEKAVALFYEQRLHETASAVWVERCQAQIRGAAAALEAERAARPGETWFGRLSHADVAVACALRFAGDAHPGLIAMDDVLRLRDDSRRLEETDVFRTISQRFIPPT
jgi:glutathione S-transferase